VQAFSENGRQKEDFEKGETEKASMAANPD
jgi:hypothetical protein